MARQPEGWFLNGMLFWGEELRKSTVLSKGFFVDVPQVIGSDIEAQNRAQDAMRTILITIGEGWSMDWHWTVDGNYRNALDNYNSITRKAATRGDVSLLALHHRGETFERLEEQMLKSQLRREVLCCCFSKRCSSLPKGGLKNVEHVSRYLETQRKSFDDKIEQVQILWPDATIRPMHDLDHYAVLRNFLNPSDNLTPGSIEQRYAGFRPDVDVMSQVFTSDMVSVRTDEGLAFKLDNHYYSVFVATRWPSLTDPTISHLLTKRLNKDYWISVKIYPLGVQREIKKEEDAVRKIALDASKAGNRSMLTSLQMKQSKIDALMHGYIFPFKVTYIVGVFDRTLDGLIEKCASLKGAFQDMSGMQVHMCNEPAQMKNLLLQAIPGWTGGPVRQWDLYASSDYLPDLLPASTTFVGHLYSGETLNRGGESNLVGTQSFANGTPQHAALMGITGVGKTVSVVDWLLQSEPMYQFTAIVEEGLNYGIYTYGVGGTTIVITAGGRECINYLDTLGLPLSAEVRELAVALCMKMVGTDSNPQRNNAYRALLGFYANNLYTTSVRDYLNDLDDEEKYGINREAYALFCYVREHASPISSGSDPVIDAFTEMRDKRLSDPEWYQELLAQYDDDQIQDWIKERDGQIFARNFVLSKFSRKDYVKFSLRHAALVNLLRSAESPYHSREDCQYVGNMLAAWTANEGTHGVLFDGATNIRLDGGVVQGETKNRHQLVHFDLGYIPEASSGMRDAAGFLVSSYVRQHIITLPRAYRKRFVFEELARFLNVEEGPKIVAEAFAQLRKFNTRVIAIFQNYGAIKGPLIETIFSNAKIFYLMKQKDRRDMNEIGDIISLPSIARHHIMNFRLPEHFGQEEQIYSSIMYFAESTGGTVCGPYRVYASRELLWVADCSGEKFDRKMKILRQYLKEGKTVYEAILAEAWKETESENEKEQLPLTRERGGILMEEEPEGLLAV